MQRTGVGTSIESEGLRDALNSGEDQSKHHYSSSERRHSGRTEDEELTIYVLPTAQNNSDTQSRCLAEIHLKSAPLLAADSKSHPDSLSTPAPSLNSRVIAPSYAIEKSFLLSSVRHHRHFPVLRSALAMQPTLLAVQWYQHPIYGRRYFLSVTLDASTPWPATSAAKFSVTPTDWRPHWQAMKSWLQTHWQKQRLQEATAAAAQAVPPPPPLQSAQDDSPVEEIEEVDDEDFEEEEDKETRHKRRKLSNGANASDGLLDVTSQAAAQLNTESHTPASSSASTTVVTSSVGGNDDGRYEREMIVEDSHLNLSVELNELLSEWRKWKEWRQTHKSAKRKNIKEEEDEDEDDDDDSEGRGSRGHSGQQRKSEDLMISSSSASLAASNDTSSSASSSVSSSSIGGAVPLSASSSSNSSSSPILRETPTGPVVRNAHGEAVFQRIRSASNIGEILDRLQHYKVAKGQSKSREEACRLTGYSRGTINAYRCKIRAIEEQFQLKVEDLQKFYRHLTMKQLKKHLKANPKAHALQLQVANQPAVAAPAAVVAAAPAATARATAATALLPSANWNLSAHQLLSNAANSSSASASSSSALNSAFLAGLPFQPSNVLLNVTAGRQSQYPQTFGSSSDDTQAQPPAPTLGSADPAFSVSGGGAAPLFYSAPSGFSLFTPTPSASMGMQQRSNVQLQQMPFTMPQQQTAMQMQSGQQQQQQQQQPLQLVNSVSSNAALPMPMSQQSYYALQMQGNSIAAASRNTVNGNAMLHTPSTQ